MPFYIGLALILKFYSLIQRIELKSSLLISCGSLSVMIEASLGSANLMLLMKLNLELSAKM